MSSASALTKPGREKACVVRFGECAAESDCRPLAIFRSGDGGDSEFRIPLRHLEGPSSEAWCGDSSSRLGQQPSFREVRNDSLLICELQIPSAQDFRTAARQAYGRLIEHAEARGYPHLVKTWNYIPDINRGVGDNEAYKQFCIGRAEALEQAYTFREMPAGTGVGSAAEADLQVTVVASTEAPIPVENPRQISAYRYPRQYGPRSPSFSRGMALRLGNSSVLFISGTASIVGHRSLHDFEIEAQVSETAKNIEALLERYGQITGIGTADQKSGSFRAYLRHPEDLKRCRNAMSRAGLSPDNCMFLQADICRKELVFEIDGILTYQS